MQALGLFLLGWQVMVAAMMLPSSLSAFRSLRDVGRRSGSKRNFAVPFLGGYVLVWTAFGIGAFLGDIALHGLTHRWHWLEARPWLIGGTALVLAGLYELSRLSARCAGAASIPGVLPSRDGIGAARAIGLGADHGLERLRRCWPLMIVPFGVGMTSLLWMAVLTLIMALEGDGQRRRTVTAHAGAGLLTTGVLVVANPSWLPALLPGS